MSQHLALPAVRAYLPERLSRAVSDERLANVVSSWSSAAARAWPTLCSNPWQLACFVAQRVPADASVDDLASFPVDELALVAACLAGSAAALQILEERYLRHVESAMARLRLGPDDVAEVRQQLRIRLCCGSGSSPPKLAEFSGSGRLSAWLRTCAIRLAINELKKRRMRGPPLDEDRLAAVVDLADDAECSLLRRKCASAFSAGFRRALAGLAATQRLMLVQHYLDGVTLEGLATLHRLSRATVARRLADARAAVLGATRQHLKAQMDIDSVECDSVMRWARNDASEPLHQSAYD